jgi:V8-like Glu-specific endopeptidase
MKILFLFFLFNMACTFAQVQETRTPTRRPLQIVIETPKPTKATRIPTKRPTRRPLQIVIQTPKPTRIPTKRPTRRPLQIVIQTPKPTRLPTSKPSRRPVFTRAPSTRPTLDKTIGAVPGVLVENGEGLPFFTSTEVQRLPEMMNFDAENYNFTGRIEEQTLVSPDRVEPEEIGEEQLGLVKDGQRVIRTTSRLRQLNVFLPDTRVDVNENAYPYRVVGRWGGCTATMVLDAGIVVTNAHCLSYLEDGTMNPSMWSRSFYAGFCDGTYVGKSKAKAIWFNRKHDYAVLKLWTDLSAKFGRYGVIWRSKSFFNTNRPLSMVSYSGDHCTSWDNCRQKKSTGSSRGLNGDDVKHDLDAKRGSSGSAMYHMVGIYPVMDALNWGEFRNGGEVSLTLPSYDGKNPNVAKPSEVWKYGYDQVRNL